MLLFASRAEDFHTDYVEAYCRQRDIPCLRLCTEDFPNDIALSVTIDNNSFGGTLRGAAFEASLDDIGGVWYRRPEAPNVHADLDETFARFVEHEVDETLYGLYRALWDRHWVNPPHNDATAGYKLYQTSLARQLGFRTPRTIVTNNPADALDFFRLCGRQMVYKLMYPLLKDDADGQPLGVYTTLITQSDIDMHLESVRIAPCLFQEVISKRYELRVNVIGDYVWSAAIHSQAQARTQLDYRHDIEGCVHEPVLLPPRLEAMCVALTRRLGLRMSNIDLIVTDAGDYVFLEANPNGQWLWVEQQVGFPLTHALIDQLLGRDTLAGHPYIRDRSLQFHSEYDDREILREHGFA